MNSTERRGAEPLAVVIGASRGIGLAAGRALAEEGYTVRLVARDQARLDVAAKELDRRGLRVEICAADALDPEATDRATEPGSGQLLQVLVSATGRNLSQRLLQPPRSPGEGWGRHPLEQWKETVELNLHSAFVACRAGAWHMARSGVSGAIILVSSSVWRGSRGQSAYAASKAALNSLTVSWALELGSLGIRVAAVAPGITDGDALREKASQFPRHAAHMDRLRSRIPLERFAYECEIAAAITHVAQNTYINGAVLEVHGGGFDTTG